LSLLSCLQTLKFGIFLMVKDRGPNGKFRFSLNLTEAMQKAKVDLKRHDMLINYTTKDTMLVNEATSIPWRGDHEKDIRFLQFVIERDN